MPESRRIVSSTLRRPQDALGQSVFKQSFSGRIPRLLAHHGNGEHKYCGTLRRLLVLMQARCTSRNSPDFADLLDSVSSGLGAPAMSLFLVKFEWPNAFLSACSRGCQASFVRSLVTSLSPLKLNPSRQNWLVGSSTRDSPSREMARTFKGSHRNCLAPLSTAA